MRTQWLKSVLIGLAWISSAQATSPLWTFSAPNPSQVTVSNAKNATVQYTVTNQSSKPKNLVLEAVTGISASSCYLPKKGSQCTVTLTINGSQLPDDWVSSGPVMCSDNGFLQCYQPTAPNILNVVRLKAGLQLSQNGLPVSSLSFQSGDSGTLTITNTGTVALTGLTINLPFGWQSYFTNNCPSELAAGESCTITYSIPTPSKVGNGNTLTIQATNSTNTINTAVSIQMSGGLKCWGINDYGQVGSTTNSGTNNPNNSPLDVQTLNTGVTSVSGGFGYHTCALLTTGAVKCWGNNQYGQLGSTTNSGTLNPNNSPLDVQTLSSGVVAIATGFYHSCALLDTGAVKCWGSNRYGQLGSTTNSGTNNPNNSPLDVQTLSSGVVAITAGMRHTCALLDTGAMKCWGENGYGQLGSTTNSGNFNPNNTPLDVQTLSSGVKAITAGMYQTCALMTTGAVKCWGFNQYGQLGSTTNSGTANPNNSPLDVQTLSSGVAVIKAGREHVCAVLDTGAVKCWGFNYYGQLGSTTNSGTYNPNNSPLATQTLSSGVVTITGGQNHSCALLSTGAVKCWGLNRWGQLGSTTNSGTMNANNSPLDVQTLGAGTTAGIPVINTGNISCAIVN